MAIKNEDWTETLADLEAMPLAELLDTLDGRETELARAKEAVEDAEAWLRLTRDVAKTRMNKELDGRALLVGVTVYYRDSNTNSGIAKKLVVMTN